MEFSFESTLLSICNGLVSGDKTSGSVMEISWEAVPPSLDFVRRATKWSANVWTLGLRFKMDALLTMSLAATELTTALLATSALAPVKDFVRCI